MYLCLYIRKLELGQKHYFIRYSKFHAPYEVTIREIPKRRNTRCITMIVKKILLARVHSNSLQ